MTPPEGRPGLLSGLFARGPVARETSELAFLQAMLDVEVALLRALEQTGLAPEQSAEELAAAADARDFDLEELGGSTGDKGTPVPGLVAALRGRLSAAAAAHLHQGATSQDVVDTATMLVARRSLAAIGADLDRAAQRCAELADRHRATLLPGRTLLQQGPPITFGLKAATWLAGLEDAAAELVRVRECQLPVQLGGAVGTLAALGDRGLEVLGALAAELELAAPALPWPTTRSPVARLCAALGVALGAMGKVARDVILLSQNEVAEVREGGGEGRGGSSTIPHKRNPVGAIAVEACARRAPGLVATIFAAMAQEHERSAGAWQSEWEPVLELLRLAGSAADALGELLGGLEVDAGRMRDNLEVTGSLAMSESVAGALAPSLGRSAAQQLVERAARRAAQDHRPFAELLAELPEVADALGREGLERALDPARYLGVSEPLIDRALAAHRARIGARATPTTARREADGRLPDRHGDPPGGAGR